MPLASPPTTLASPSALSVAEAKVVDVGALLLVDLMVLWDEAPEQNVEEPATPVEGAIACEVDPDIAGNEPRPVVPRPLVPRPATPTPAASGEAFAAVGELPELDEDDDGEEAFPLVDVVRELGEVMMPELLTELHGADGLAPTP
jgi:hypothetical protein